VSVPLAFARGLFRKEEHAMESADVIGIIGLVLSAATLLAMIFGIRLGRKALARSVLFGKDATNRYDELITTVPKDIRLAPTNTAAVTR
jgi:hypothetical protein